MTLTVYTGILINRAGTALFFGHLLTHDRSCHGHDRSLFVFERRRNFRRTLGDTRPTTPMDIVALKLSSIDLDDTCLFSSLLDACIYMCMYVCTYNTGHLVRFESNRILGTIVFELRFSRLFV